MNTIFTLPISPNEYRIETKRLLLRSVCEEDEHELFSLMSKPQLSTFLAWEPHASVSVTNCMIHSLLSSQRDGTGFHWVVIFENKLVGLVSFIDVRRKHRTWILNRAELAYLIGEPYQGRGIATEAAFAVMKFGYMVLGFHKIIVYHASRNIKSKSTIEKLKFRFIGEELEAFRKDNEWHNLCKYELLDFEFPVYV